MSREADALARCAKAVLGLPTTGWGPFESKLGALQEAVIQYEQSKTKEPRVKVVREGGYAQLPTRAYPGDAGYDLYCSMPGGVHIPPRGFADIPTGVRIELPDRHWALLTGRSGSIRNRGILVVNGIIDNGYRGPLYAACQNMTEEVVCVRLGERIAQLIPMVLPHDEWVVEEVDDLSVTQRGSNGFGSSGQ